MKKTAFIFLLLGLIFLVLSLNVNLTGAVIGTEIEIHNYLFFVLSLAFILVSLILFTKKSLESLVIPTGETIEGGSKKRVEKAMENYFHTKEPKPYILVTGLTERDKKGRPKLKSQQYQIYDELRHKYNLKPSDMIIEGKSRDTLENFLYSIKKLKKKGINHMKIATSPIHYRRFKLFEKQAKKEGIIDESFEIEPLYTSETPREFIYGILAYVKDYFRVKSAGSLEKAKKYRTGDRGEFIKKITGGGERKIKK